MNMNTDLRITILGRGMDIDDESSSLEVLVPPRRDTPRPSGDQSTGITLRGDYREILHLLQSLGPRFQEIQPRHVSLKLTVDAPAQEQDAYQLSA